MTIHQSSDTMSLGLNPRMVAVPEYQDHPDEVPHFGPEPEAPEGADDIVIEIEEDFGAVPSATVTPLDPETIALVRRQRMLSVSALFDLPPIQWFLEGLLPAGPCTVMHGKGGTRKSFIILDWMLCADQGLDWHGHFVKPGRCLYMAGEGVQGLSKRIRAWAHPRDIDPFTLTTDFMAIPLNLFTLKPEQVEKWRSLVATLGYDYIVVDTLHTASSGADENSSQDIGTVYENARRIAGDSQLFYIHHDPKVGKTARGSSAIRDDADVVIEIDRDPNLDLTSIIKPDKIRDADDFMPMHVHFELHGEGLASSLYITGVGHDENPGVFAGHGQKIINILDDQPGRTKNEVLELLGNHKQVRESFDALADEGEIYTKKGPHQEGAKVVQRDLWYAKGYEESHGE